MQDATLCCTTMALCRILFVKERLLVMKYRWTMPPSALLLPIVQSMSTQALLPFIWERPPFQIMTNGWLHYGMPCNKPSWLHLICLQQVHHHTKAAELSGSHVQAIRCLRTYRQLFYRTCNENERSPRSNGPGAVTSSGETLHALT